VERDLGGRCREGEDEVDEVAPRVPGPFRTGAWRATCRSIGGPPSGAGKSFVACALGNQAGRQGHSVRHQRFSRLLDDLAMARAAGPLVVRARQACRSTRTVI